MTGLERAIAIAGGQAELARRLDIDQTTVWHWLHHAAKGRAQGQPPAHYVVKIVDAVSGEVSKRELRPDVFLDP